MHAEVGPDDGLAHRLALVVVRQQRVLVSLVRILAHDLLEGRAGLVLTVEGVHAVKYVFPAVLGGETRGIPTAWAAAPLAGELALPTDLPPVWPDAQGRNRGVALEPLHHSAPEIARRDPALGERLALIDALRLGDARVRGLAAERLRARLASAASRA